MREHGPAGAFTLRSPRSPASAWPRKSRSPSAPSPPRIRVERHDRSHTRRRRPCTEHGQRCSPRGTRPKPCSTASTATRRGFTGQGPEEAEAAPGHYPDPIRSDTSRHETVAAPAEDSSAAMPLPSGGATSTIPPRAASPALPRRRARSAAPEVPSTGEPAALARLPRRGRSLVYDSPNGTSPLGGRGLSTGCYQPVDNTRRLLAISLDPPLLTERRA